MEFRHYEGSLEYFRGLPRKIGEFVTRTFLSPYPLMTEREYNHPLDEPIEPVIDWPPTREQLSEAIPRWENRIIPDVAGRDISRNTFDDMGRYYDEETDAC